MYKHGANYVNSHAYTKMHLLESRISEDITMTYRVFGSLRSVFISCQANNIIFNEMGVYYQ